MHRELTFIIEDDPAEDSDSLRATLKQDREPDADGRVPGATFHGLGETPLEAVENYASTCRENFESVTVSSSAIANEDVAEARRRIEQCMTAFVNDDCAGIELSLQHAHARLGGTKDELYDNDDE